MRLGRNVELDQQISQEQKPERKSSTSGSVSCIEFAKMVDSKELGTVYWPGKRQLGLQATSRYGKGAGIKILIGIKIDSRNAGNALLEDQTDV